jgi:hypothetical protein
MMTSCFALLPKEKHCPSCEDDLAGGYDIGQIDDLTHDGEGLADDDSIDYCCDCQDRKAELVKLLLEKKEVPE